MEPKLHLIIGKIASGKSTLAKELGGQCQTVVLSEDEWISGLWDDEIKTIADYVRLSKKLRGLLKDHIVDLLKNDLSVVLDFQANTKESRVWMQELADLGGTESHFHFLDVPDEVCKERLRLRNERGDHEFAASDAQFDHITSFFQPPQEEEGLNVIHYSWAKETFE